MSDSPYNRFEPTSPMPSVVVIEDEEPAITEAPKKKPAGGAPKWETDARERVKTNLRKFSKPLQDLVARDANEGDTRWIVTDFLEHALGYDKYEELTTEYGVKGEFADYGIRIDKELIAFVEVKRVATKLAAKHLRQVEMYAVNEGVEWMILTNGVEWRAYHLTGGLPVEIDLALDVNLLGDATPTPATQEHTATSDTSRRSCVVGSPTRGPSDVTHRLSVRADLGAGLRSRDHRPLHGTGSDGEPARTRRGDRMAVTSGFAARCARRLRRSRCCRS